LFEIFLFDEIEFVDRSARYSNASFGFAGLPSRAPPLAPAASKHPAPLDWF
jgi:hypothetical protein